jgi:hypothetical protein
MEPHQKGLKNVNVKMTIIFIYRTWVPGDDHYRWLQGPINPLPMERRAKYLVCTIRRILDILQL